MAHRLPQPRDKVRGRKGHDFDYEGMKGVVVSTDPPRASQHKCTVLWEDGGEDYVESSMLTITSPDNIVGGMTLPRGLPDCDECEGAGWVEPADLPNDTVLAHLGLEPCSNPKCAEPVEKWYEDHRSEIAAVVV
jgi:hypothetical protein